ncbi:unnamed protein product [Effrenium voratum]|nr:unnamed protein product [Effrenium voratum]
MGPRLHASPSQRFGALLSERRRRNQVPTKIALGEEIGKKKTALSGPQVAISNPALLDPSLCPAGKLVLHLYGAGNEPFDIWAAAQAEGREAYEALKQERAERLWQALEEIIPDARARAEVQLVGSPLTHRRFLRRTAGTYGPAPVFGRFGPGKVPFRTAGDALPGDLREGGVDRLLLCGDSTFPGIGVPAAVVSGLSAAHTTMSVWEHLELLGRAGY